MSAIEQLDPAAGQPYPRHKSRAVVSLSVNTSERLRCQVELHNGLREAHVSS
jgi:hypothetical protein